MDCKELCGGVHTAPTQQCHWVLLKFVGLNVCVGVGVGQCEHTIMRRSIFRMVSIKCSDFQYNFNTSYGIWYVLISVLRYFLKSIMSPLKKITPECCVHWRSDLSFCFPDPSFTGYYSEKFCIKYYPETRPCPPFQEDMFGVLHNYTNPRPITADEIAQVSIGCIRRLYH